MNREKPKIVAEIGCNHKGDTDIAREMIGIAASFTKSDYVKFQKRSNQDLLTPEEYAAPHPNPANSYGESYGQHREFLEFNIDQHRQLQSWCNDAGIGYSCSVWDLGSAREIAGLEPDYIKIPSACNLNRDMLRFLARDYGGDIHIALGMTTPQETDEIVDLMLSEGAAKRTIIYACTSAYPVAFEDVCLLEVSRLVNRFGSQVKAIGFSGHHLGISVDVASLPLGATWIERHFTLDRTWKGTDHAASLEPDGMRRLVRDVAAVHRALTHKQKPILDVETEQRAKLKRIQGIHFQ